MLCVYPRLLYLGVNLGVPLSTIDKKTRSRTKEESGQILVNECCLTFTIVNKSNCDHLVLLYCYFSSMSLIDHPCQLL